MLFGSTILLTQNSFCRKITLTRHQRLCHLPGSVTQSSSDDATTDHFYQAPSTSQIPYDRYLIAQQPGYPQFLIPIHESAPQQNVLATEVPVHESSLLIAADHVPATFQDIQHTQQQYNSIYNPYNSMNMFECTCYMGSSDQLFLIIVLLSDNPSGLVQSEI